MKRQTILALLLVGGISVFAVGMLASFAGPVAAATTGLFGYTGVGAATLIPMSIEDPTTESVAVSLH